MTTPTLTGQPAQAALPAQEEFKDLGFGAEVARGTHRRLLNRNGGFNVVLDGLNPLSSLSLYHWLLTISWPQFLAFIVACYIGVNALFAFAFLLCGPDALQSIVGSFTGPPFTGHFFSASTRLLQSATATLSQLELQRTFWLQSKRC